MTQETDDVNEAIAAELRLMDPAVRASRTLAAPLLDPEFVEVGASGRRYTYDEMAAELPSLPRDQGPRRRPVGLRPDHPGRWLHHPRA